MNATAVKRAADELAQVAFATILSGLPLLKPIAPNIKFYRRLAGLRGSDLDWKQDDRYDAAGKRRSKVPA